MDRFKLRIKIPSIEVFFAALIILWLNAGFFTFIQIRIPSVIMYGIVACWYLLIIKERSIAVNKIIKIYLQIVPALLCVGIPFILKGGSLTKTYLMSFIYVFIIISIRIYYFDCSENKESANYLFNIWRADVILVLINTFYQIAKDPYVIRNMSANASAMQSLGRVKLYGVASFSNVLCYLILALFLFSRIINKKTKTDMATIIAFFPLTLIIFLSQITLIIMFFIFGLILLGVSEICRGTAKTILFSVPLFILGGIAWNNMTDLLKLVIGIDILPTMIRAKLYDVISILNGSHNNLMDANVRIKQYQVSIESFLNNPIIGSFGDSSVIGGHSTFMDFLGLFGFLAVILFIWHIKMMRLSTNTVNTEERKSVFMISIVFTLLGILDPIIFQNVYMIFVFIIPIMSNKKERVMRS